MRHAAGILVLLVVSLAATQASAQGRASGQIPPVDLAAFSIEAQQMLADDPDGFGLQASFLTIPVTEFQPLASGRETYSDFGQGYRKSENGGGTAYFAAGVGPTQGIPIGAYVFAICAHVRDSISDGQIRVSMWGFEHAASDLDTVADHQYGATTSTGLAATPGWTQQCTNPSLTIRTSDDVNGDGQTNWTSYYLLIDVTKADPELRYGSAFVWWWRQISPAPASASFSDVPTNHWAFQHIEALAASGITAGCGGGGFCPDQPLTRAQMAVFLAKALGLHWVF